MWILYRSIKEGTVWINEAACQLRIYYKKSSKSSLFSVCHTCAFMLLKSIEGTRKEKVVEKNWREIFFKKGEEDFQIKHTED